ncbi:MAG: flagellar motor switch protein FliN [Deltaproteobacteria bacterium]|nr:flagellar motor switch protein FliN [Deltaproteobacteria bacterium]
MEGVGGKGEKSEGIDLDSLLDIPVEISVEIGKRRMTIGELLSLSKGSIVELDKFPEDPVEIYVNDRLLGKGEIVVSNDRLGIRVLEIVTPKERVQKLG